MEVYMDKDKIEMKTLMGSDAVAEYLTQLAKGFKSGVIVVEKNGESLTLTPTETAEVEVEARMKKDKARFSLEVTWRIPQVLDEPSSLSISAEAAKAAKCGDKLCDTSSDEKEEKKDVKLTEKMDDKKTAAASVKPAVAASVVKPAYSSGSSAGVNSKPTSK
jgi:amphi-Trp domain-containing protein